MSLSKIYRGSEANGLKEFQFRSFGEAESSPPSQDNGTAKSSTTVVPSQSAGNAAKEIKAAYNRGHKEALENAENNLEAAAQALATASAEINRLRDSVAKNSGQDMLRLVMAIAEQVIRREVAADPKILLSIIENALQSSVRTDQYRIHINPADLESVTQQKPLFLASISGLKNLNIEADPDISPGGCRVDSDLGDVDATLETQLETIRQSLSEAISDVG
ncbi:flagellar assembly protein FliH [Desulfuromusa kysingii]|uniref:Flagellar assembly protein FliH n=1 Tax=Desulfuromusa kysingii TaxID=37625 RepID=A0A1H3VHD2_9BACT|nr:flagellar assembly protein FliH [Desulfuromusa kysingii]SDZ74205.1 flagellar assembly protein FliH [Desulfuromusa kysingii]